MDIGSGKISTLTEGCTSASIRDNTGSGKATRSKDGRWTNSGGIIGRRNGGNCTSYRGTARTGHLARESHGATYGQRWRNGYRAIRRGSGPPTTYGVCAGLPGTAGRSNATRRGSSKGYSSDPLSGGQSGTTRRTNLRGSRSRTATRLSRNSRTRISCGAAIATPRTAIRVRNGTWSRNGNVARFYGLILNSLEPASPPDSKADQVPNACVKRPPRPVVHPISSASSATHKPPDLPSGGERARPSRVVEGHPAPKALAIARAVPTGRRFRMGAPSPSFAVRA